jgi:transcription elongation factor GreA
MSEQPYLTAAGAEKLRNELIQLKGPARLDISQRLRSAIQMGDLSENADYHKAKEDQAFLEGRIQELEYILGNAIIVEDFQGPREVVEVGATITVQEDDGSPEVFLIVGAKEASPREGKISNESPIGKALLGHRQGDVVPVQTPDGQIRFKILQIK